MSPAAQALTGRMHCVCSYCGDRYGDMPATPEQEGRVSHGICPACFPAASASFEAQLRELFPSPETPNSEPSAQQAMHAKPGTVRAVVYGSARYVFARDIALLIGVGELEILNRYRPEHWGSPRDFRLAGSATVIAEARLSDLARELAGECPAAAEKLREYAESVAPAEALAGWATRWEASHDV